ARTSSIVTIRQEVLTGRIVVFTSVTLHGVIATSRRPAGPMARWPARPRCRRLGLFSFRDLAAPGLCPSTAADFKRQLDAQVANLLIEGYSGRWGTQRRIERKTGTRTQGGWGVTAGEMSAE